MISDVIEKFFKKTATSRDEAKRRLKLVIAHDRAGLNPQMMELMRQEILEVVTRYLDIDSDEMQFAIESDQRMTALIANVPIRKIKARIDAEVAEPSNSTTEEV